MSKIYQGSTDTVVLQKGAIGAEIALVIPFENSGDPASFLNDVPNLRLIRINSDTNLPEYYDGSEWVILGNDPQNITSFYVGQPTYPTDGAAFYTNANFAGKQLTIDTTIQGALIYGKHYRRYNGNTSTENVTGDTIKPIAPISFQEGDSWRFIGGLAITGSDEILAAAEAYTDAAVENNLLYESYESYTEIPLIGSNALIFCNQDNSPNGDNTESQFIRQNNKLFYLVAVEQ